jgi:integrase/recombinase XerC
VLDACKGKGFASLRDKALIRLYANTGARLSEVGNLQVADLDLKTEAVHFHGKGAKDRRVRFGPKTARALSKYLRAQDKHRGSTLPNLWLADRGAAPLTPNGIKIRLKRLGQAAGVPDVHAHRTATASPTNGSVQAEIPGTSCCYSAGRQRTCPGITEPARPSNGRWKHSSA